MDHQVFISYAEEDKPIADAVCKALEDDGIRCWYAPRDVPYGVDYEVAIVDAISASKLMVLVLSSHANDSKHVTREVQNACREEPQVAVLPFQVEDISTNRSLKYYLGSAHRLRAVTPPLEDHLRRLVEYVQGLTQGGLFVETSNSAVASDVGATWHSPEEQDEQRLKRPIDSKPTVGSAEKEVTSPKVPLLSAERRNPKLSHIGVGLLMLAVLVGGLYAISYFGRNEVEPKNPTGNVSAPSPSTTPNTENQSGLNAEEPRQDSNNSSSGTRKSKPQRNPGEAERQRRAINALEETKRQQNAINALSRPAKPTP